MSLTYWLIMPKVAQSYLNRSHLVVQDVRLTAPLSDSITLHATCALDSLAPYTVTLHRSKLDIIYNSQPIGYVESPEIKSTGSSRLLFDLNTTMHITNATHFDEFVYAVFSQDEAAWTLKGKVSATAHVAGINFPFSGLSFTKQQIVPGFHGMRQLHVVRFDVAIANVSDVFVTVNVSSPSDTYVSALPVGRLSFDLSYDGAYLSTFSSQGDANLRAYSDNTILFDGIVRPDHCSCSTQHSNLRFVPRPLRPLLPLQPPAGPAKDQAKGGSGSRYLDDDNGMCCSVAVEKMLSNYLMGNVSLVTVKGSTHNIRPDPDPAHAGRSVNPTPASSLPVYAPALTRLAVPVPLANGYVRMALQATMFFDPSVWERIITTGELVVPTALVIHNPFGADVTVSAINLTASFNGTMIATSVTNKDFDGNPLHVVVPALSQMWTTKVPIKCQKFENTEQFLRFLEAFRQALVDGIVLLDLEGYITLSVGNLLLTPYYSMPGLPVCPHWNTTTCDQAANHTQHTSSHTLSQPIRLF